MDLDGIARELYGLPPDEFTKARDRQADEVKRGGDGALAAAVKRLRRPTAGAWAANLLVRERPDLMEELRALGEAMRHAQAELAGTELRRLAPARRQLVARLATEGRRLATDAGRPMSDAANQELESTLEASVADAGSAAALGAGTLATALSYSGFGGIDLLPGPTSGSAEARDSRPTGRGSGRTAKQRGAARSAKPSGALRAAADAVAEAERQLRRRQRDRQRADEELTRRHRARLDGEERTKALRRAEAEARAGLKTATQEVGAAERALRAARKRLDPGGRPSSA